MSLVNTFFWLAKIRIKSFISSNLVTKIFVMLVFGLLAVLITTSIYFISYWFFAPLASQEIFGFSTATYIINASIVVIFWLCIGSGLASSTTSLIALDKAELWLLTLPIHTATFTRINLFKQIILNTILFSLVFLPITIAFSSAFKLSLALGLTIGLFTTLTMVIISLSVANLMIIFGYKFLTKINTSLLSIGLIVAFLLTAVVFSTLLLPQGLYRVYSSQPAEFEQTISSLPINQDFSPSLWLTEALTQSNFTGLLVLWVLAVGLFVLTDYYYAKKYLSLVSLHNTHPGSYKNWCMLSLRSKIPIFVQNDLAKLLRTSSEVGYSIFMSLLALFFFLIMSTSIAIRPLEVKYLNQTILFAFGWIVFYSLSYGLRIIYPLVAKDRDNFWLFLSSPNSKASYILQKIFASLILTTPLSLISIITFVMLPLETNKLILIGFSLFFLVISTTLQVFLGAIAPSFSSANSPEQASTSFMGLITLIIVTSYGTICGFVLHLFLNAEINMFRLFVWPVFLGLVSVLLLSAWSRYKVKDYATYR